MECSFQSNFRRKDCPAPQSSRIRAVLSLLARPALFLVSGKQALGGTDFKTSLIATGDERSDSSKSHGIVYA